MSKAAKPFTKGQSGNPAGKPKGIRSRKTLLLEAMIDDEDSKVARNCIAMAKAGDTTCIRIVMERLLPPRKDRPVEIELPKLETAGDAVAVTAALFDAVAAGEITPSEAGEFAKMVGTFVQAFETQQLEERLARLEAAGGGE